MILVNGKKVSCDKFPDGTFLIKDIDKAGCEIQWLYENNEELIALCFITRYLQEAGIRNLNLNMPYIPNARQDRIKNEQDVFTLKYFAEIINAMNFKSVKVLDPHSQISLDLIQPVETLAVKPYIEEALKRSRLQISADLVCYPDEGSQKRYHQLIEFPCVYGKKIRNWEDGKITGLEIIGDIPKHPFNALIIDDICSKGYTFLKTAQKLKELGAKEIYLYVTHCENTILEGELIKSGLLRKIYTTNSIFTKEHPQIEVIPVF